MIFGNTTFSLTACSIKKYENHVNKNLALRYSTRRTQ